MEMVLYLEYYNIHLSVKIMKREYTHTRYFSIVLLLLLIIVPMQSIFGEELAQSRAAEQSPLKLTGLPDSGNFNYVTIADMNKDGFDDIIAGSGGYPGDSPGGLYVYINKNGASFTDSSKGLPGPGNDFFGSVQVIDIDGDSNLDIIAAYESHWSQGNNKGIGIWLGNGGVGGTMSFTTAKSPINTDSFDSAYCADINNDGELDLATGGASGLFAWEGDHSTGSLSWNEAKSGLPTSGEYTGVVLGDINNDNRLDLVAGSYNSQGISIYLCSSSGSISWSEGHTQTNLIHSGNTFGMSLTDFNGDDNLDIVAGIRGGMKAYLGNGNKGSRNSWWKEISKGLPTSDDYYQIAIEDIDSDGKLDIGSKFKVWSNSGNMDDKDSYNWEVLDLGISESKSVGLTINDLNNDDFQDIIGCGWGIGIRAYALYIENEPPTDVYYKIYGTVTDQQNALTLPEATVRIDTNGIHTQTTNQGQYEFEVVDGIYEITVTLFGYRAAKKIVEVSGTDKKVDFQLIKITDVTGSEYILNGQITEESTVQPIQDITIELQPGDFFTTTDNQGYYSFTLTNGSYILKINADGYESLTVNIEILGNDFIKNVALKKETVEPSDNDNSDTDGNEDSDNDESGDNNIFLFIGLLIAVVVVIIVIALAYLIRKRGDLN